MVIGMLASYHHLKCWCQPLSHLIVESDGLPPGAIVGIIIATLIAAVMLVVVIILIIISIDM